MQCLIKKLFKDKFWMREINLAQFMQNWSEYITCMLSIMVMYCVDTNNWKMTLKSSVWCKKVRDKVSYS